MGKTPFLPPPLDAEQGRGGGAPAAARFGAQGEGGGREEGEKGWEGRGVRFPSSPRLGARRGSRAT